MCQFLLLHILTKYFVFSIIFILTVLEVLYCGFNLLSSNEAKNLAIHLLDIWILSYVNSTILLIFLLGFLSYWFERVFTYTLDASHLLDICVANVSSLSGVPFRSLNNIFWWRSIFNFNVFQFIVFPIMVNTLHVLYYSKVMIMSFYLFL